MSAEYEAAVMREMLAQARRCARLEMALEEVRKNLDTFQKWSGLTEIQDHEVHDLIARIDAALEDKT